MKNYLKSITSIFLMLSSLFLLFISGRHSKDLNLENLAQQTAIYAENKTISGKYLGMIVEPKDGSEAKLNNTYNEFHYLYGTFKSNIPTFAGVVNSDKKNQIIVEEFGADLNFSYLYADNGFSNKKNGNYYRQEFYPLDLMFVGNHIRGVAGVNFCYIPQSKADILLDKQGLEHTYENYESLLGFVLNFSINGEKYQYWVEDIYIESNYFYEPVHELIGDFLFGPAPKGDGVKKQSLYILNNQVYQNKYFIKYAGDLYSINEFDYLILKNNLKENEEVDDNLLLKLFEYKQTFVSNFLFVLSCIFLLSWLVFYCFDFKNLTIKKTILYCCLAIVPWLIFYINFLTQKNILFFSSFSTIRCLIFLVIIYLACINGYIYKKIRNLDKRGDKQIEELYI